MSEVRCGTCRHYVPERNPDTGRSLPSRNGECAFEVVVTSPLPYGVSVQVYRAAVWSYSGMGCPCHDPKKKGPSTVERLRQEVLDFTICA